MKMIMSMMLVLSAAQGALAACDESSAMTKAARSLRLSGTVLIEDKDSNGKPTGATETDTAKRLSSRSEEYKVLQEEVGKRGSQMISPVFGLEGDGSVIVVVRNETTCELSILGTDGEEIGTVSIVPNSITSNSISFYRGNPAIVTITKVKKSRVMTK